MSKSGGIPCDRTSFGLVKILDKVEGVSWPSCFCGEFSCRVVDDVRTLLTSEETETVDDVRTLLTSEETEAVPHELGARVWFWDGGVNSTRSPVRFLMRSKLRPGR